MGNSSRKIDWEFACKECSTHYLVEIISHKDIILIKRYCFCDEETLTSDSFVFYYMKLKTIYYQLPNFAVVPEDINKYCCECNKFLYDTEFVNHCHKTIINAADYIYNCKLHKNQRLTGFCKSCKKLICEICINSLHEKHEIEYAKNLKITEEILKKYETDLQNAFLEMNKLIKLKYGKNSVKVKNENLYEGSNNDYNSFDKEDIQIIMTLKLLKTFIDLYNNHKIKKYIINYQIISNILKNKNFEILRIEDNKRYTNSINIFLKIDFENKNDDKLITITSLKNLLYSSYEEIKEVKIELIEDYVYFFVIRSINENRIQIYKNCKDFKNNIEVDEKIISFKIFEDYSLIICLKSKVLIYKFSKDEFILEKKIDLKYKLINFMSLAHLKKYNFSLLIYNKDKNLLYLQFYIFPEYKGTSYIALEKSKRDGIYGKVLQTYKWITVGVDDYAENYYMIFIYDIIKKKLKNFTMKKKGTYYNSVKIYEIVYDKVLISFQRYSLIINLENQQIVTKIKFGAIECLNQIGDYLLLSSDDYIYQVDIKKGKIYNKIKLLYSAYQFTFKYLIDIYDNFFCGISRDNSIYLFQYK